MSGLVSALCSGKKVQLQSVGATGRADILDKQSTYSNYSRKSSTEEYK